MIRIQVASNRSIKILLAGFASGRRLFRIETKKHGFEGPCWGELKLYEESPKHGFNHTPGLPGAGYRRCDVLDFRIAEALILVNDF